MLFINTHSPRRTTNFAALNGQSLSRFFDDALISQLAEPFLNRAANGAQNKASKVKASIVIDVRETATAYELAAELPGFSREQIKVEIDSDTVTIAAEKISEPVNANAAVTAQSTAEHAGNDVKVEPALATTLKSERVTLARQRSLQFEAAIDAEKANARFENGVLYLTLPKQASAQSRRVEVK